MKSDCLKAVNDSMIATMGYITTEFSDQDNMSNMGTKDKVGMVDMGNMGTKVDMSGMDNMGTKEVDMGIMNNMGTKDKVGMGHMGHMDNMGKVEVDMGSMDSMGTKVDMGNIKHMEWKAVCSMGSSMDNMGNMGNKDDKSTMGKDRSNMGKHSSMGNMGTKDKVDMGSMSVGNMGTKGLDMGSMGSPDTGIGSSQPETGQHEQQEHGRIGQPALDKPLKGCLKKRASGPILVRRKWKPLELEPSSSSSEGD